jgi:uncharacterized membrane protein YeaQ/YmgE (transglycosylase-associated protein family)
MEPQRMNPQQMIIMGVTGIAAGWLGSLLVGGVKGGLLGYLIAGLVGSVVGGMILNALGAKIGVGNPIVDNIITSAIGATVVILIARIFL